MISLILDHIYWAVFLGTIVAGDTATIIAGLLAQLGFINLPAVIVLAAAGSFVSDSLFYSLGRLYGREFIDRRPRLSKRAEKIDRLFQRHKIKILLSYRFLAGFRIVSLLIIGSSRIPLKDFFFFNIVGSLIWAAAASVIGFLFGHTFSFLINRLTGANRDTLALILIFFIIGWLAVIAKILLNLFTNKFLIDDKS